MKPTLPWIAVLAVGLGAPPATSAAEEPRVVLQGSQSGIQKPAREIVRTQEAWEKLWKSHRANVKGGDPNPPKVDWAKEMVVAIFMGARPTGGYAVRVRSVVEEKEKLVVTLSERKPGPTDLVTQAFTAPFCVVAVARSDKPVEWKTAESK